MTGQEPKGLNANYYLPTATQYTDKPLSSYLPEFTGNILSQIWTFFVQTAFMPTALILICVLLLLAYQYSLCLKAAEISEVYLAIGEVESSLCYFPNGVLELENASFGFKNKSKSNPEGM